MTTVHSHLPRWLMAGVALAISATFAFEAISGSAAPVPDATTFVPLTPCRLFDYRPAPDTVGTRPTPLGSAETALQQVTGAVGACNVPATATAVSMNVTIVTPTAASYLTLFPADLTVPPLASNLNWAANQSATPNKVDVKLSPTGAIKLFNLTGSVNVLADVVGYHTPTALADLDARIAALEAARPIAASVHRDSAPSTNGSDAINLSATIQAPVAGTIQIVGTAYVYGVGDTLFHCRLSQGVGVVASTDLGDTDRPFWITTNGNNAHCATTGAIAVGPGTYTVNLVVRTPASGGIDDSSLDALFVPGGTVAAATLALSAQLPGIAGTEGG